MFSEFFFSDFILRVFLQGFLLIIFSRGFLWIIFFLEAFVGFFFGVFEKKISRDFARCFTVSNSCAVFFAQGFPVTGLRGLFAGCFA